MRVHVILLVVVITTVLFTTATAQKFIVIIAAVFNFAPLNDVYSILNLRSTFVDFKRLNVFRYVFVVDQCIFGGDFLGLYATELNDDNYVVKYKQM